MRACIFDKFDEKVLEKNKKNILRNHLITFDFAQKHPDWDWIDDMNYQHKLTIEYIESHPDLDWNRYIKSLSVNKNITPELIEKHLDWDWKYCVTNLMFVAYDYPDFIEDHPDWEWNHSFIRTKNLTMELLKRHLDWNWSMCELSKFVTMDFIEEHHLWKWQFSSLVENPNITLEFFRTNMTTNFMYISQLLNETSSPLITEEIVKQHPKWYWYGLFRNKNISLTFIEENLHLDSLSNLTMRKDVSVELIEKTNWIPRDFTQMSKKIFMDMVKKYPDETWNYNDLSNNRYLDFEYLDTILDKVSGNSKVRHQLNMIFLSKHKRLTQEFVRKNKNLNWHMGILAKNPIITMDFVEHNPDMGWDSYKLCKNPSLSMEYIEQNPNLNWYPHRLSTNPALKPEFVQKHSDWGWTYEFMFIYSPYWLINPLSREFKFELEEARSGVSRQF